MKPGWTEVTRVESAPMARPSADRQRGGAQTVKIATTRPSRKLTAAPSGSNGCIEDTRSGPGNRDRAEAATPARRTLALVSPSRSPRGLLQCRGCPLLAGSPPAAGRGSALRRRPAAMRIAGTVASLPWPRSTTSSPVTEGGSERGGGYCRRGAVSASRSEQGARRGPSTSGSGREDLRLPLRVRQRGVGARARR